MNSSENTSPQNILRSPYLLTYLALMALLGLTFLVAHMNLGILGVPAALFIAVIKAGLVLLYFMKLRTATSTHRIFAFMGLFWLFILIAFVLNDYLTRVWTLLPGAWV